MKTFLAIALIVSVFFVIVEAHKPCDEFGSCDYMQSDCKEGFIAECHDGECHCHEEFECSDDIHCVAECGTDAICDGVHCHGSNCTHHN